MENVVIPAKADCVCRIQTRTPKAARRASALDGASLSSDFDVSGKQPAIYILASDRKGTLYIGVTSDLPGRVWQHRNDVVDGFSQKHQMHKLVYYEQHLSMEDASLREKRLEKWNRAWKLRLIEEHNPYWHDLYPEIMDNAPEQVTGFPPARE